MHRKLKPIDQQVIVITGATSGIGRAAARKAAQRGARLVLAARNGQALDTLCQELHEEGCEAVPVVADVGDESHVRRIAQAALERFGRFDTWVNNAGVSIFGRYDQVPLQDQRRLFDTNFWGVVAGSLVAVEHLRTHGGALINIGSEVSDVALPLQGMYSASKHAVRGFTDSLRMELEHEGAPVSVTLIKPTSIDTMFVEHAKNFMDVEPRLPPPLYAPEVVADAILFAAQHPKRDIFVGSPSKLFSAGARFAPRLTDKLLTALGFRMQRSDQPAGDQRHNSLYVPQADSHESTQTGGHVRRTSFYTQASLHPKTSGLLLAAAGLGLALLWQSKRRPS